jgi:hypothetical protein
MGEGKNPTNSKIPTLEFSIGSLGGNPIKINLTGPQRKILILLSKEDAKYCQKDLINYLKLKKSTVSYSLQRLEQIGLIRSEKTWPKSYLLSREAKRQFSNILVGYEENIGIYDRSHAWKFKVNVVMFGLMVGSSGILKTGSPAVKSLSFLVAWWWKLGAMLNLL